MPGSPTPTDVRFLDTASDTAKPMPGVALSGSRGSKLWWVGVSDANVSDGADVGGLLEAIAAQTDTPPALAESHERADWVQQAVRALPDHQRMAVILVFFEGLKYGDAAEILRLPEGTFKSRVHKALLALRKSWRRDHRSEVTSI